MTRTLIDADTGEVGVPSMKPSELRVRPAGNVPDASDHTSGAVPPVALSEIEYGTDT